jgi:WD40 repeat protein
VCTLPLTDSSTSTKDTTELACTSSRDRSVRIWSPLSGDVISTFFGHNHFVGAVTSLKANLLSTHFPAEACVASGGNDGLINIW